MGGSRKDVGATRFAVAASALSLLSVGGCGGIVVVDGDLCLGWSEDGPIDVEAAPPDLACEIAPDVEARYASTGSEVPAEPKGDEVWVDYVCISTPDDGLCPAPRAAEALASPCLGETSFEDCSPVGGLCTRTSIWSMCGPDPSASGACCYYATMVSTSFLSAVGTD